MRGAFSSQFKSIHLISPTYDHDRNCVPPIQADGNDSTGSFPGAQVDGVGRPVPIVD